ncbi:MAG: hypothetical protein JXR05_17245, partial [Flavobacteriaceae bacterium]
PEPALEDYNVSEYVAPSSEEERKMVQVWEGLLGLEQVGVTDNFFSLGGDSIIAIQLVSRAKNEDLHFKVSDVFTYQTISDLCSVLGSARVIIEEQGVLEGSMGLLPIHSSFFQQENQAQDHYNQSMLFSISKDLSSEVLSKSIDHLVVQHDALRLRYVEESGVYLGSYDGQAPVLETVKINTQAQGSSSITEICKEYQKSLDLNKGAIARFVRIVTESEDLDRLFIVVHHLAVDGVSWRILMDDLTSYLETLLSKGQVELVSKGTSYRQWQARLSEYAGSARLLSEVSYWKHILSNQRALKYDHQYTGETLYKDTGHCSISFSKELTDSLLYDSHGAYGTEINDLLLSALSVSLCSWQEVSEFVIALEGHGREELFEDVDISRTVGWFTSMYPVLLQYDKSDLTGTIISVKESLRSIPDKGIGYGVLRYLADQELLEDNTIEIDQVVFNYLGQFGSGGNLEGTSEGHFTGGSEDRGYDFGLDNKNPNSIGINGLISGDCLHFTFSYDGHRYDHDSIVSLAEGYKNSLEEIVKSCKAIDTQVLTPWDYGLSGLVSYQDLDEFQSIDRSYELSDIYVLSPLQQGLMFHSLYENNPSAYLVQMSFDLVGDLNVDHFGNSWAHLMSNHSILRTGFDHNSLEVPVQYVQEGLPVPLEVLDYREESQEALETFLEKDKNKGFVLDSAPLFRLSLLRLAEDRYKLVLTNHHLILDGWSTPIVLGGFIKTYQQLLNGDSLSHTTDNYGDYIRSIQSRDRHGSLSYWSDHLSGLESASALPFVSATKERNKVFSNRRIKLEKGADFMVSLEAFCQQNHITVNTVIQGVWSYLLSRYTGSSNVVYGTVISGRDGSFEDVESRVGLYINTIPLCVEVRKEASIADWLTSIQSSYTSSREEHGYCSLSEIQSTSTIEGELFDSLMVFENYPLDSVKDLETDLRIENFHGDEQTNYVLSLTVQTAASQALTLEFGYNDEILSDAVVEMIRSHFESALESLMEASEI